MNLIMVIKTAYRSLVLVRPGWPNGFCPMHVATGFRCSHLCITARIQFKQSAAALDQYWASIPRTHPVH
jgi:hypothetical protein